MMLWETKRQRRRWYQIKAYWGSAVPIKEVMKSSIIHVVQSREALYKTFVKTILYILLGSAPGFLIGFGVMVVLVSVDAPRFTDGIVLKSYLEQIAFFEWITRFNVRLLLIALMVASVIVYGVHFTLCIRLFNSRLSSRFIKQNEMSSFRAAIAFICSLAFIFVIMAFFARVSPVVSFFIGIYLFCFLWHERGVWGSLEQFKKDSLKRLPLLRIPLSKRESAVLLWRVCLFSLWLFLTYVAAWSMMEIWFRMFALGFAPGIPWGPQVFMLTAPVYYFLGGFVIPPLVYTFFDMRASASRIVVRSSVLLIATIAFFIPLYQMWNAVSRYEFDKNFGVLAGFNDQRKDIKTVIEFGEGAPRVFSYEGEVSVQGLHGDTDIVKVASNPFSLREIARSFLFARRGEIFSQPLELSEGKVSCSRENVAKVEMLRVHLERRDYRTFLSIPYFDFLAGVSGCYAQNWEIDNLVEAQSLSFLKNNNILDGFLLIGRGFAIRKDEYVALLDEVTDETAVHIGKRAAKNLGDLYTHYGKIDKAREFYRKAREQGYNDISFPLPDTESVASPSSRGIIRGYVTTNETASPFISVGLLVDADLEEQRSKQRKPLLGFPLLRGGSQKRLAAAVKTNAEGSFIFENVLAGEYYLGILLDNPEKKEVFVAREKQVNKISISDSVQAVDLGVIALAY